MYKLNIIAVAFIFVQRMVLYTQLTFDNSLVVINRAVSLLHICYIYNLILADLVYLQFDVQSCIVMCLIM